MNQILQKLLLLLFLLTGLTNNSEAFNAPIFNDTTIIAVGGTTTESSYFDAEIEKDAEDSIKLDIINQKAYLYVGISCRHSSL